MAEKKDARKDAKAPEKPLRERNLQASLRDEIANTYLRTAPRKKTTQEIIRGMFTLKMLPWLIAAFSIAVAFTAMFTKSQVDVRVRILGEIPSVTVEGGRINFENLKDKGVFLMKGTSTNGDIVKSTSFMGDALTGSSTTDEHIVLSNAKGSGWANYTIELKEPVDLGRLDLKFVARGNSGGELLGLVIVDIDKRSYRMDHDASTKVSRDWQLYKINFRPVRKAIDLSSITAIKFEFGNLTVGNGAGATIFLKDIYLSKARKIRWL